MTETNDQALAQENAESDSPFEPEAAAAPQNAPAGEARAAEGSATAAEATASEATSVEPPPTDQAAPESAAAGETRAVDAVASPNGESADQARAVTGETKAPPEPAPAGETRTATAEAEASPEQPPAGETRPATTEARASAEEPPAGETETSPDQGAPAEMTPTEQATPETAADDARTEPSRKAAAPPNDAKAEAAIEEAPLAASALPFAAALEAKNPVEGKVIGWNKGGFHVACDGVTTFCPRSLMELGNRPRPPSHYVNNTYAFHVLEIKESGRRIVLTRRPAIRSERRRALDEIRARQQSREPVSGKVTSITEFGAFVDLGGGLGGLVHRTQISRTRSGEPADLVKVGQQVDVLVTKVETRNRKRGARISLSMKALEADPWKETAKSFTAGATFQGKVARHSEFGLFVELAPGLDGLVHTSQLPIGKSMSHPAFAVGEEIEGWVVEVAPRRRRIALSLREVPANDPWKNLGSQYVEGAEVEGTVEQVSRFGVFVVLEPGLTGLLPMSAVSAERNQTRRIYPPGREIKVVIESIDRKRRRLGLAPSGSRLVGTRTDYKKYRQRQKKSGGLNVMAAAFAKLQQPR